MAQASAQCDNYGWSSSWRGVDDAAATLWNASDGAGTWLFGSLPSVWIVETATMTIVAAEETDGSLDVVSEVTALNN